MEVEEAVDVGEKSQAPIDLLDRQSFVEKMINVTEILANSKKNVCYAVNGNWGVGKSFVLDMFEQQISQYGTEETTRSKYLVFHYNCWQYDFYEEPLVAIIAVILDTINEQTKLFSENVREAIQIAFKKIGRGLPQTPQIRTLSSPCCPGMRPLNAELNKQGVAPAGSHANFYTLSDFTITVNQLNTARRFM